MTKHEQHQLAVELETIKRKAPRLYRQFAAGLRTAVVIDRLASSNPKALAAWLSQGEALARRARAKREGRAS